MTKLTDKQKRFADEYLIDLNATQAAIRAGYSDKTAESQGSRLLSNVKVQGHISSKQKKMEDKTNITIEWIINELVNTYHRCKQKVNVLDHKGKPTGEWRFDATNSVKCLELLGKHLGMFKEKTELAGINGEPIQIEVNDIKHRLLDKLFKLASQKSLKPVNDDQCPLDHNEGKS